ncbi:unnamed protein product [Durusdinium trenchii]|uniref:Sugar phosphate/phosphate translocator n=2 Tax=Durusdinium trenchii TaxID=1381693 RepID=A0ABP0J3E9_9DINO
MLETMPLGLNPCAIGASELWRPEAFGAVLAVGSARNAASAATTGELLGCKVSHIVTVGSYRNYSAIAALLIENGHEDIEHQYFRMSDWLRPDEELDLKVELSEALQALQSAVQPMGTEDRIVLLHCDQGHNRSPTLALSFFLYNGHNLRQAYQRLLQARPDVDPLPPYRRGLQTLESELYGEQTVFEHDYFARHITELMSLPNIKELACACPASFHPQPIEDDEEPLEETLDTSETFDASETFSFALTVRRFAIAALMAELTAAGVENGVMFL